MYVYMYTCSDAIIVQQSLQQLHQSCNRAATGASESTYDERE